MQNNIKRWIEEVIKTCPLLTNNKIQRQSFEITRYSIRNSIDVKNYRITIMVFKKPKVPTIGIGSICKGDKARFEHCIFLDYDWINEYIVREELEWLVERFKLTNFYLFYTERYEDKKASEYEKYYGNYHAISLTKMPFARIVDEILPLTTVDETFRRCHNFSRYKMWVLRFVNKRNKPKPTFLDIIPKEPVNMFNRISKAHLIFLKTLYNVPDLPYQNLDDSEEIIITPYLTLK